MSNEQQVNLREQWLYDTSLVMSNDYDTSKAIEDKIEQLKADAIAELSSFLEDMYHEAVFASIKDNNSLGDMLIREHMMGIPAWWMHTLANKFWGE